MNGQSVSQKPNIVQVLAVVVAGVVAGMLAFALSYCAMFKIYVEPTMLMAMSTILGGIAGAVTTILVGKSISQLNNPDEPIPTQIQQPLNQPVPVVEQPPQTP